MKKYIFLLALVLNVFCSPLSAQVGDWIWARTGISNGGFSLVSDIACDSGNNMIVVGWTEDTLAFSSVTLNKQYTWQNGNHYNRALYVMKYDPSGNILWWRFMERSGDMFRIVPANLSVDAIGDIYILGYNSDSINIDGYLLPGSGIFLCKLNGNTGQTSWVKRMPGGYINEGWANNLSGDRIGNSYVGLKFAGTIVLDNDTLSAVGNTDAFIAKIDKNGQSVWIKSLSGVKDQSINHVATDIWGNVYLAGSCDSIVNIDGVTLVKQAGYGSDFMAKLDSSGNLQWLRHWGNNDVHLTKMVADSSGNLLVLGYSSLDSAWIDSINIRGILPGAPQSFVAKYDSSASMQFVKTVASGGIDFKSICLEDNGLIWIIGNPTMLGVLSDSNIAIDDTTMVIASFDSVANLRFYKLAKGSPYSFFAELAVAKNGDVYVGGTCADSCDFGNIQMYSGAFSIDPMFLKLTAYPLAVNKISPSQAFALYPNPNNGIFTIKLPPVEVYESLRVVDQLGKVVYAQSIAGEEETIQLSNISDGIYYLQLSGENGTITGKFIVHH